MKRVWNRCALAALATVVGCGAPSPAPCPPEENPLRVEEWKALPPSKEKFEIATLERIKVSDPKYQKQQEWDRFLRDVVVSTRKKEFPNGLPR